MSAVNEWPFLRSPQSQDYNLASFIAPTATILGWVEIAADASIWYGVVLRGDVERISIGSRTNVQDGVIIHGDPGEPTILAADVTIGHRAVIHSAHIEAGCMIGIGSVILNGVTVGQGSLIGAGAIVTRSIPPGSMALGVPARVIRELTETEKVDLITHAHKYVQLAKHHTQYWQTRT